MLFVRLCFVAGTALAFHQMNCHGLSADEFTGLWESNLFIAEDSLVYQPEKRLK